MSDKQKYQRTFVIPQKKAGKRFKEATAQGKIDGVRLETTGGTQLINLPIQMNIAKVVPKVFRLTVQAGVTATSAVARVFGVNITFGLKDDES